jgi:hypothetical protein
VSSLIFTSSWVNSIHAIFSMRNQTQASGLSDLFQAQAGVESLARSPILPTSKPALYSCFRAGALLTFTALLLLSPRTFPDHFSNQMLHTFSPVEALGDDFKIPW